ncbi:DUF4252 domain-containing protein [Ulvibacterium marinum]|uniref:DUF4252 domain-containing protein n=1 Tax=Ulvibacterium marinum TaxID=2419782 RepID=A0A3B0C801_9FLAO|nr:DUF4252 domain-containing protein [Ulvibacterium marinum]RKN81580.1 DUF4252 domain-containing protein [Ulvibacterium marinum]
MKQVVVVFLMAVTPLLGFSQSIFDKYEDMDNVGSVVINKGLINLVSSIDIDDGDQEAKDFVDVARGLDGIKVFITEDKGVSTDMHNTIRKYVKSSSLEELMRVKDKDANVKFYIKNGKNDDHVYELLMFVQGINDSHIGIDGRKFESILVSLTGDIDLNKVSALTKKMNLPDELNKVGNK